MVIVYRAVNIAEAQILLGLLQSHGIDGHVGGYYLQGGIGEAPALNTATIHVADGDVEEARKILEEYEREGRESANPVIHNEIEADAPYVRPTYSAIHKGTVFLVSVLIIALLFWALS